MNNIIIKKGEDRLLSLIITDSAGVAIPLTGQTVKFRCRRDPSDSYLYDLTNTSAQHEDALNGLTAFLLDKDISSVAVAQIYYWEIEIVDEATTFKSIQDVKGSITLKESV